MNDWANQLLQRFPILGRLRVRQPELSERVESLPPFLGIAMAVMETAAPVPVCFLLPRRGETARLVAVLYGLHRFCAAQTELTKRYGESTFTAGDLVRIHPGKHVFRYCGFDARAPEFICLRPVNGTDRDRWSVRAATFVPRLERTTLTRPMGKMNTPIHDPDPAPLDHLLGTFTFGNQGLFRNEITLLDSSTGFQRFVEETAVHRSESGVNAEVSLKTLLPFGDVTPPVSPGGSWLTKWDDRNPSGEPLIATTSSAELLARLCIDAPARSKLVVVNGLSRLRDLQSFDDIQQTQRIVLFADDDDEELVGALGSRGCRFWELTSAEIAAGTDPRATFDGMFGKVRLWARNKESQKFDAEACESGALDDVAIRLDGLRRLINTKEDGPATKIVGRMWRILNDTAAIVRSLTEDERQRAIQQLTQFRRDLAANKAWLTDDAEAALSLSVDSLESLLSADRDVGRTKREAVERIVAECLRAGTSSVVLVRSENQAVDLDQHFRRQIRSGKLRVSTPRGLKADAAFDRIICLSWPGSAAMEALAISLAAPQITLVGYAFERRWLGQCAQRLQRRSRTERISDNEKAGLIGRPHPSDTGPLPPPAPITAKDAPPVIDEDIWTFEQRLRAARKGSAASPIQSPDAVPARYVGFVGTAYAFLTETHHVVTVTDLIASEKRSKQRLPEKVVGELKHGDFIVFPESGDRELILEKADQLLGSEAPTLRKTARAWKEALWASTLKPAQFLVHARDLGRPRHIMTIRNWFADSAQIGPGTGNEDLSEDLELIALVTDHEPLKLQMSKTIEAIRTLRSAHLSAGVRLRDILIQRLPEVIGRIEEEGSVVDLGDLGSAWIVQVESIAAATEGRTWGEVNRLLWEAESTVSDLGF
jgi:hypothetical protein